MRRNGSDRRSRSGNFDFDRSPMTGGLRQWQRLHYSELKCLPSLQTILRMHPASSMVKLCLQLTGLMIGIRVRAMPLLFPEKLGLDEHIIEGASGQIDESVKDFETILADLEKSKQTIEQEQEEILAYRKRN